MRFGGETGSCRMIGVHRQVERNDGQGVGMLLPTMGLEFTVDVGNLITSWRLAQDRPKIKGCVAFRAFPHPRDRRLGVRPNGCNQEWHIAIPTSVMGNPDRDMICTSHVASFADENSSIPLKAIGGTRDCETSLLCFGRIGLCTWPARSQFHSTL